ncbi:hypothetical protein CC53_gp164 [Rhizobium phage vB_RleS_L338C]|uniref:hypothetical protein n=1 Tax=Rhizobium phage vB_RleS_L338C TaxID=1414737 RepID=UPI0003D961E8|nr:hypothetical protein CC53_gp164 [Rhizobium phage vB_RleS_L338C]AHC30581.1 hypothetical protein L338C_164 [Rhizobium phage vB_RleS_L338C]QNH72160.1 hypothetical protein P11VFA_155 [Rhizobium phage P11VFA]
MKIITFKSENAPPEKRWVAYWLVAKKEETPPTKKAPPSKEGIMPYSFWGTSEEEAVSKAQIGWNTSFGKGEALKAAVSTVRVRVRA